MTWAISMISQLILNISQMTEFHEQIQQASTDTTDLALLSNACLLISQTHRAQTRLTEVANEVIPLEDSGAQSESYPLVSGQSPTHSPIWIINHPQPHHHHLSTSSTSTSTIRRRRLSSYRGGAEGGAKSHTHTVVGGAESHALW